ncbi:MAG: ribonuclease [Pseudomonadota bacterium]|jgi:ribonuclease HII
MDRGDLERAALERGNHPVGIDEVGRGCIAGPVVVAAVVLDYPRLFSLPEKTLGLIRDSKSLSARQRGQVVPVIHEIAQAYATASAGVEEIERLGILGATFVAMRRALDCINRSHGQSFDLVLVDGNQKIPEPVLPGRSILQQTVVKGDHWCYAIAAASILAKEERDRFMHQLGGELPQYGFEKHVGYGTPQHIESLKVHGVSPWHRRGFEPVRSMCQPIPPESQNR